MNTITKAEFERITAEFDGVVQYASGFNARITARFDINASLVMIVEGSMLEQRGNERFYCHNYEHATHIKFNIGMRNPTHFFGKGARSTEAWEFGHKVMAAMVPSEYSEAAEIER